MMAPPKFPDIQPHSRGTPRFLAPHHLSPFSPPDCNRSVDSPALSGRCYPRVRPVCWGTLGVPSWVPSTVLHISRNLGLLLRRCGWQGPHAAKTMQPRGFFRVAAGFSSYDVDFRLPLVLALGSPNFPSSCEGKLDVVLKSLQGQRDLI